MTTIILSLIKKYWAYLSLAICVIIIYCMLGTIKRKNSEIARKTSNIEVLNANFNSYKVAYKIGLKKLSGKDSIIELNAAKVGSLSYTVDEFKQFRDSDVQTIEALKLKLKNVISVTNIGTQTDQHITTPTIKTDSTTCFNYKDEFLTMNGCVEKDSADITYENTDKLTIIPSTVAKHHFLWWEWGVKGIQLDVLSHNPHTTFTYEKYYDLKK